MNIPTLKLAGAGGATFGPVAGAVRALPVPNTITGSTGIAGGAAPAAGAGGATVGSQAIQTGTGPLMPQSTAAEKAMGMPMEQMQQQQELQELQANEQKMDMQQEGLKQQLQLSKIQQQMQAEKAKAQEVPAADPELYNGYARRTAKRQVSSVLKKIEQLSKQVRATPLKLKFADYAIKAGMTRPTNAPKHKYAGPPLAPMNIHTGTPQDPAYDPKLKAQAGASEMKARGQGAMLDTQNSQVQRTIGNPGAATGDSWMTPVRAAIGTMAAGGRDFSRSHPWISGAATMGLAPAISATEDYLDRRTGQDGDMDPALRYGATTDLFANEANKLQRMQAEPATQQDIHNPDVQRAMMDSASSVEDLYGNRGAGALFSNITADPDFGKNVFGLDWGQQGARGEAFAAQKEKEIAMRNNGVKPGEEWNLSNLGNPLWNAKDKLNALLHRYGGKAMDMPFNIARQGVGSVADMADDMHRVDKKYEAGGLGNVDLRDAAAVPFDGLMAGLNFAAPGTLGPAKSVPGNILKYLGLGAWGHGANQDANINRQVQSLTDDGLNELNQVRHTPMGSQQLAGGQQDFDWKNLWPMLMAMFGNDNGNAPPQASPSYSPSNWRPNGPRY